MGDDFYMGVVCRYNWTYLWRKS